MFSSAIASSAELAQAPTDASPIQPGRLVVLKELAPILRMSEAGVRAAVARGQIPAMRFGGRPGHGRLLFDLAAVRAALQPVGPCTPEAGSL